MLGLGVSLAKEDYAGGWLPSDEGTDLAAWYQNKVGITTETGVSQWADQSGNGHHMVQTDTGEQPAYNASTGALTFDPSDTQNLMIGYSPPVVVPPHITLDADFIIGIKMHPTYVNTVILGSNSETNEMFKIHTGSVIRLKNNSSGNKDFTLDSGNTKDDSYWVIARDSNAVTIYKDGVANPSGSISVPGTFDINAIGVRKTDLNPYAGAVKEVVIFKGVYDTDLIANLNDRLSGL